MVLEKNHYQEVHHAQELAKIAEIEIGCHNVYQNLHIDMSSQKIQNTGYRSVACFRETHNQLTTWKTKYLVILLENWASHDNALCSNKIGIDRMLY